MSTNNSSGGGLNIPDINYENQENDPIKKDSEQAAMLTDQTTPIEAVTTAPTTSKENIQSDNGQASQQAPKAPLFYTKGESATTLVDSSQTTSTAQPSQPAQPSERVQPQGQPQAPTFGNGPLPQEKAASQQSTAQATPQTPTQPQPSMQQQAPTFSAGPTNQQGGQMNGNQQNSQYIHQPYMGNQSGNNVDVKSIKIVNYVLAGASYLYGIILMFMHHGAVTTLFFATLLGLGIASLILSIKVPKGTKGRGMSMTAGILSIVGFLLGWIPFVNIFYVFTVGLLALVSTFMFPTNQPMQKSRLPYILTVSVLTALLAVSSVFTVASKIARFNYYKAGFMSEFMTGFNEGFYDAFNDYGTDDFNIDDYLEGSNPDAHDSSIYEFFYDITPEMVHPITENPIQLSGARFVFSEPVEVKHGTVDYLLYNVEVSSDDVILDSFSFSGVISETEYIFESSLYDADEYGQKLESAIYDNMRSAERSKTVTGYIAFPKNKDVKYIEIIDYDGEYGSNRVYVEV